MDEVDEVDVEGSMSKSHGSEDVRASEGAIDEGGRGDAVPLRVAADAKVAGDLERGSIQQMRRHRGKSRAHPLLEPPGETERTRFGTNVAGLAALTPMLEDDGDSEKPIDPS